MKGFDPQIISRILNAPPKKKAYSNEDICEAVLIKSISTKAYETIRKNHRTLTKLPHITTLNRKLSKFKCTPGFQNELFHLVKLKLAPEKFSARQCVIVFDEISLKEKLECCPQL